MSNLLNKTIYFVGSSCSGKTTAISYLIHELTKNNISVATIKFMHHKSITIDRKGKDTSIHREAGALYTIGLTQNETAILINKEKRDNLEMVETMLQNQSFLPKVDLYICESYNNPPKHAQVILTASTRVDLEEYYQKVKDCNILYITGKIVDTNIKNYENIELIDFRTISKGQIEKIITTLLLNK